MKVIILCGGNGTRMQDYSFPKPLNMIHGIPSIFYCLQNLPDSIHELHFIIAPHLYDYHIEQIIINQFKKKQCFFYPLPYFTRGPIESAWLGTKTMEASDESVVFLDNDVLYQFPEEFFKNYDSAFLGYSKDDTCSTSYSYIMMKDKQIIDIKEKKRISDDFCCGVYGFSSLSQFRSYAKKIITSYNKELYMSLLYNDMITDGVYVSGVYFSGKITHIGTLSELQTSWNSIHKKNMRVCFDLDNTLVTYPTIPGDYSTVKPIKKMVELSKQMKKEGHTIIIYTARRMETHHNNVGAVIRDIGKITIDTLDRFEIPYDELLFGKPIADMYIDDRAVNPYRNDIQCMGYLYSHKELPINSLPTNKYNRIYVENDTVIKLGPSNMMEGEYYYYKNLPSSIQSYFPSFIKYKILGDQSELHLEYIKHIPFSTLYQSELLTEQHLDILFEYIDILHHTPSIHPLPTQEQLKANYVDKLIRRFKITADYPFENASHYQTECLERLYLYIENPIKIAPYIHGDLWFSNILLTYQQEIKCIDMKGNVDDILTTGGDILYDYGKIYQSILGYDNAIYGTSISNEYYNRMKKYTESHFTKKGLIIQDIHNISLSLMIGTFHAITSLKVKERVWSWLITLF
jgi:capsule biosynthesis phosphatase